MQVHCNNNPSQSIEGHCRVNLSTIFIDHALKQLDSRFATETNIFYQGFSIVPSVMLENTSAYRDSVEQFCQHYSSDLSNIVGLSAELTLCKRMWKEQALSLGINKLPDRVSKTLAAVDLVAFLNNFSIVKLIATLTVLVTAVDVKRPYHLLDYSRNYSRNTTGQDRLNGSINACT